MSFFLSISADQGPVPFPHAGTGTVNTLVLALLSFIADLKPDTVIFAMEGQRSQYLRTRSAESPNTC